MAGYIHGTSDEREVARLEKQAGFIAPLELKYFDASSGHRVLDLATGVGAMAAQLVRRFPGIQLTGMDMNERQLEHARSRHPVAQYIQGDAAHMPFPDASFDRVHCSWLLEHVRDPLAVLSEVRRVLAPNGYCQFIEVDNATFATEPRLPEVERVLEELNRSQLVAGGDPFIAPKLAGYFERAGFQRVRLIPCPVVGDATDPAFFQAFVTEFAEIIESLDEALGAEQAPLIHTAAAQLRSLPQMPGARMRYEGTIAQGFV
jgi:ubiquinone/menaquinone biosynthesis C-methylase UbiE